MRVSEDAQLRAITVDAPVERFTPMRRVWTSWQAVSLSVPGSCWSGPVDDLKISRGNDRCGATKGRLPSTGGLSAANTTAGAIRDCAKGEGLLFTRMGTVSVLIVESSSLDFWANRMTVGNAVWGWRRARKKLRTTGSRSEQPTGRWGT